jgi:hypothetical protein
MMSARVFPDAIDMYAISVGVYLLYVSVYDESKVSSCIPWLSDEDKFLLLLNGSMLFIFENREKCLEAFKAVVGRDCYVYMAGPTGGIAENT